MANFRRSISRALLTGASLLALGACSDGLDLDLRGVAGGLDTTEAVRQPTERRPNPDERGLITYPTFQVAVARRGDTLRDVANRIEADPLDLAGYNGIGIDTKLRNGEVIALPASYSGLAPSTPSDDQIDITALAGDALDRVESDGVPRGARLSQTGPEPIQHQVERGETAYTIARLYNVSVRALADWNGLGSDLNVREGQFLLIPLVQPTEPEKVVALIDPEVSEPGEGTETPLPPSASTPLPEPDPEPPVAETPAPPADLADDRTVASAGRFSMPVQGAIIRDYEKGKSDGIDISASAGSAVKAAGDGTVAAITRDTEGVPILVLRHTGNLLTVYANIDDVTLAKGDKVSRGQTVAKVRGDGTSFLHFEVREGFDSVDPIGYLN